MEYSEYLLGLYENSYYTWDLALHTIQVSYLRRGEDFSAFKLQTTTTANKSNLIWRDLIMTDELPLSTDLDVYEAIPLDIVPEAVTNRATTTTGRKKSDSGQPFNRALRCVIALIVLWVLFTVWTAWDMRLLPTFWLHDEWIPAISYSN